MTPSNPDILARYLEIRAVQRALNSALTKTLSRKAVQETARNLGLSWGRGRIMFDDAREADILIDAALYDYFPGGGKSAVERYAVRDELGADQRLVIDAMCRARVTLVELRAVVPGVGVMASDLVFGHEFLLADQGLAKTADEGVVLVARLLEFPTFTMSTGAASLFEPGLADIVASALRDTVLKGGDVTALDSKARSRIARLLFYVASVDPNDVRTELANVALNALPGQRPASCGVRATGSGATGTRVDARGAGRDASR